MSKEISFMRKDLLSEEQMEQALSFLNPIFENDGQLFKKMLDDGSAYLESKSFTIFKNLASKTAYRIMGNCIGPVIYVRDIFAIEE